jgi:pimeloyl-ACP methyl ester carboxylesterase
MCTPPADRYFEHRAARLRYRDDGAGFPLLFVHGWTLDLEVWEPQVAGLRDRFRAIRLDRRGFGVSSGVPSVVEDVSDLQALIDHLQLERIFLIGSSQGARVALDFALAHPRRVSALVLDGAPNTTLPSDSEDEVPLAHYRELVRTRGLDAFRKEWARHPFTQLHTRDQGMRDLLAQILARYPGGDLREPPRPMPPHDAGELGRLRGPALVVNGEFDTDNRRANGDALARALPAAERRLLPRAGHLANLDEPHAYNDMVRRFLARQASIAA